MYSENDACGKISFIALIEPTGIFCCRGRRREERDCKEVLGQLEREQSHHPGELRCRYGGIQKYLSRSNVSIQFRIYIWILCVYVYSLFDYFNLLYTYLRYYADYLCLVKDFKPWMAKAEEASKVVFEKPKDMSDCLKLIEDIKVRVKGL